jgi:hypothetical protein
MPIKTFRGKIADGADDTIRLSTQNGMTGYRIVKFQVVSYEPMSVASKSVVKIYTVPQDTATATIDFEDSTMLAVGLFTTDVNAQQYPEDMTVIFDNMIFNQDIFITHQNKTGSADCNYYLELEQLKLNQNAQTVATLKDIRTNIT